MTWILKDDNGTERELDTRAEAESEKAKLEGIGATVDISKIEETSDASKVELDNAEVVEMSGGDGGNTEDTDSDSDDIEVNEATKQALDTLSESMEKDPLNVLPKYMITKVDGKPSLNKRGVSVLAYHYDIDVTERDVVAYPHDHDYKTAVVEIIVESGDGRTFSGIGEAHVDETPKHQLLRMAETRAYKRAVIFATGTGIVSYQEMTGQLGGDGT